MQSPIQKKKWLLCRERSFRILLLTKQKSQLSVLSFKKNEAFLNHVLLSLKDSKIITGHLQTTTKIPQIAFNKMYNC